MSPMVVRNYLFGSSLLNLILLIAVSTLIGCQKEQTDNQKKDVEGLLDKVELTSVNDKRYLPLVDSLQNLSKQINYKKGIAKSLSLKGSYFYINNHVEEALTAYREAVKVSLQVHDLKQLGNDYYTIGDIYFNTKNRDEALVALKQSAAVREESRDSIGLGASYNYIGYFYWVVSDYDSAVYYFESALKIRNQLPNKAHRATTYNNLGTVYYNWSLYDKALDHYFRALELQKEQNNNNGMSRCLCNIGLVYQDTGQNDKAIEYYQESLPFAYASKQIQNIGYAYNCLGVAFSLTNNDSAIFYLKKSLETYSGGKDTVGEILALQGLGHFYLALKDLKSAKTTFFRMLELSLHENINVRTSEAYKCLGQIFLLEDNLSLAKQYFEKSIVIGDKSTLKLILRDSFGYLSEIYERTGRKDLALDALKKQNNYRQELENEGMQKRLSDLKNKSEYEKYQRNLQAQKYENEKQKIYLGGTIFAVLFLLGTAVVLYRMNRKTKKINLLLKEKNLLIEGQSIQINLKNVELLELNEAKEKLFSIIAHDLRSPFNTLINVGTLLIEEYPNLTDDERLSYITLFEETAINTYELVENLLNLSASRTGRISFQPSKVSLIGMVEKIISLSIPSANKKGINITNAIKADAEAFADQSMLEIIMRNLLNNAIKYCKSSGQIELSSYEENNKCFITVSDNGIGIDDETKVNIFNINIIRSRNGTGGERGTGLGLGLCKEFVEKHGGSILVESDLGKGSKFVFSLPFGNNL